MKSKILDDYVCMHPFTYLDIQLSGNYMCCPSWLPKRLDDHIEDSEINTKWFTGPAAKEIRSSMVDGSYSYCDHLACPSIQELNRGIVPYNFKLKEIFLEEYLEVRGPEIVLFGFDRSCNLKCPSCRTEVIPNDKVESLEHIQKINILHSIDRHLARTIKKLIITGSGDPFYSKLFREYLINFESSKYPALEEIQLVTNGQLCNKKMWKSLKSATFIKTIEISIDAGTKNTYENITRINGKWSRLWENIRFLDTVVTIDTLIFSMVVSEKNFTEMKTMYDMIEGTVKNKKWIVNYRKIMHWESGMHTSEEINGMAVVRIGHNKYKQFREESKKIECLPRVSFNW